jgi:transcriptional regulator with XRE-family HTH domain
VIRRRGGAIGWWIIKPGDIDYRVLDRVAELRQRRIALGITQEQVASRIGLHRPAWSEIEAGRQHISLEQYLAACEYLGIL